MKKYLLICAFMLVPLSSGCGSLGALYTFEGGGILYSHTVRPLSLHRGPVVIVQNENAQGEKNQIDLPYAPVGWASNAIGAIAKKAGMSAIHYADLETWSVLGIWSRQTVHVYGTVEKQPQASRADNALSRERTESTIAARRAPETAGIIEPELRAAATLHEGSGR